MTKKGISQQKLNLSQFLCTKILSLDNHRDDSSFDKFQAPSTGIMLRVITHIHIRTYTGLFTPAYTHTRVRTLHEWNMGGGTLRRLGWAPPAISCESTTFMAGVISLCFFLVLFIFLLLSAVSSPLVGLYPLCGTFSPFVGDSYRFHLCAGSSLSYFS